MLKEKLTMEKGGHFHLCIEGSLQVCEKLPEGQVWRALPFMEV